jgi:uncharacterized protein
MTSLILPLTRSFSGIYLFLFAIVASSPAAATADPSASPPPRAFLWKVEGVHPSWLFGTVHSSDARVATLPESVTSALAASRSFHPEIELSSDVIGRIAEKLFQPDTADLASRLPPRLWARLVRAGEKLGLPEPMLHQLTPGTAALLLSAPAESDPAATVDGQLYARAKDHNLTIAALETIDEQLDIFDQLSDPQAIAALSEALDEIDAGRPGERKLLAAYAMGDERAVLALVEAECAKSPASRALADPLLYRRNRLMAQRLTPHLGRGGAFVAIGVAHLLGPKGLIALLQARGYKITRVP